MPQLQPPENLLPKQHCLARALYDNVSDSPDELAFRKGDTLTVLEQNAANIEGWWLCSLRGRQGICPANRLRLIPGVYDEILQNRLEYKSQVITPKKYNDVYLYDMPTSRSLHNSYSSDISHDYDVPPRAISVNDFKNTCSRCPSGTLSVSSGESYDVPRSLRSPSALDQNIPDYDVPRPHHKTCQQLHECTGFEPTKELQLELNSALEVLEKLQSETTSSISKLLAFVGPAWRSKDKLEHNLLEIRLTTVRLKTSLHNLTAFAEATLGNATKVSDKNLSHKLAPLVYALKASGNLVSATYTKFNENGWDLKYLSENDELEQLVACCRALTEDIRQIASCIQGNGLLLFKKDSSSKMEDYDYIRFDDGTSSAKNQDQQVLAFFATHLITEHKNLIKAIDIFLYNIEHNQPPKVFLSYAKFVVFTAYKLVHIADNIHRVVSSKTVKDRAKDCANALSNILATTVNKTKQAALQFPTVTVVQAMVDSVVDIAYYARDLKICIVQAANPII